MYNPTQLQNTSIHLHKSQDSSWDTEHCGSESHLEKFVSQAETGPVPVSQQDHGVNPSPGTGSQEATQANQDSVKNQLITRPLQNPGDALRMGTN